MSKKEKINIQLPENKPRGLSAIIEQIQKEGKIYDPLTGETHDIGRPEGTITSSTTER